MLQPSEPSGTDCKYANICKHMQTVGWAFVALRCAASTIWVTIYTYSFDKKLFVNLGFLGITILQTLFILPTGNFRSISAGIEKQLSHREFCCHGRFTGRAKIRENDCLAMRMYPLRSIIPSSMQLTLNLFKILYITSSARSAFKYLELSTVHCTALST